MCLTDEQIKEVMRTLQEIPRMKDQVGDIEKELNAIKVNVCGNGKEGLISIALKHTMMLEHHQAEYTEIKARLEKKDSNSDARQWALWMVVIGTVVNIAIGLIK